MEIVEVFGPKLSILIVAVGVAYFLLSFAPVIWPAWLAFRHRPNMRRPWFFVGLVAVVVYGLFSFLAFALLIPVELYGVFVAPSLEAANMSYGAPVLATSRFVVQYWWLAVPPTQLFLTWWVSRRLQQRWERICDALAA